MPSTTAARFNLGIFPPSATPDARRLVLARGRRAIGDGFVSVLLPAYLIALGYNALEVGALTTATLLGSATLTLSAGFLVSRFGHRRPLLAASVLMGLTGIGFATQTAFWPLLVVAFVGTLNPSAGDASVFLPLEQSLLSHSVAAEHRTALFARYSVAGSLFGAAGTALVATPGLLTKTMGVSVIGGFQLMFLLYGIIVVSTILLYRRLSDFDRADGPRAQPLGESRAVVLRLAALFSLASFGSGFFVQTLLATWRLETFGLPLTTAGAIFFGTNLLVSYLVAVPVAKRFGLINTMVFTHLPSSLCLIAIPFVHNLAGVVALLLVRSLLSDMDVPTRTSYVMAVVRPEERAATASITAVPRTITAAISPMIAGYLMALSPFA